MRYVMLLEIKMEISEILNVILFILGGVASVAGFYIRGLYGRVDALERDMVDHRVEDAKEFVSKTDMQILKEDIRELISPLSTKLGEIEKHLRHPTV